MDIRKSLIYSGGIDENYYLRKKFTVRFSCLPIKRKSCACIYHNHVKPSIWVIYVHDCINFQSNIFSYLFKKCFMYILSCQLWKLSIACVTKITSQDHIFRKVLISFFFWYIIFDIDTLFDHSTEKLKYRKTNTHNGLVLRRDPMSTTRVILVQQLNTFWIRNCLQM